MKSLTIISGQLHLLHQFKSDFVFILFNTLIFLEYSPSDESDGYDKGEYDKLGSGSGSASTFSAGFCGLLRGVGFTLGVTISADESCDGDGGPMVS